MILVSLTIIVLLTVGVVRLRDSEERSIAVADDVEAVGRAYRLFVPLT